MTQEWNKLRIDYSRISVLPRINTNGFAGFRFDETTYRVQLDPLIGRPEMTLLEKESPAGNEGKTVNVELKSSQQRTFSIVVPLCRTILSSVHRTLKTGTPTSVNPNADKYLERRELARKRTCWRETLCVCCEHKKDSVPTMKRRLFYFDSDSTQNGK